VFHADVSRLVQTLARELLRGHERPIEWTPGGRTYKALQVNLNLWLTHHVPAGDDGSLKSYERRDRPSFLVCGNRSVWFREGRETPWANTCNHDVGWTSCGVESPLNLLYWRLVEEIRTESGDGRLVPARLSQHCGLDFIVPPWQFARLTHRPDPADEQKLRRTIVDLKPWSE
jgi:hypothetical protein